MKLTESTVVDTCVARSARSIVRSELFSAAWWTSTASRLLPATSREAGNE
ncbi:MAG: hypothetical protein U1F77_09860 [Kiritimatiellia bacterium]